MNDRPPGPSQSVETGTWIGRIQAFSLIGSRCSAAQAECLRHMRQEGVHKLLGLTWEEFRPQHLQMSRASADGLIRQLEEFGTEYFRLSEIMRLSPEGYREIAGAVHDNAIEIDGELVAITVENAPRIRAAVQAMRAQLNKSSRPQSDITALKTRMDAWVEEVSVIPRRPADIGAQSAARGLVAYAMNKLTRLASAFQD
jgi:hypothetical protein